jgi:succinate-semialdehyde dehydrogenase/glutarate-semialdehyde dehydrogenase
MTIGGGLVEPTSDSGPCIDMDRVDAVNAMVEKAILGGIHRLTRSFGLPEQGSYCAPAALPMCRTIAP